MATKLEVMCGECRSLKIVSASEYAENPRCDRSVPKPGPSGVLVPQKCGGKLLAYGPAPAESGDDAMVRTRPAVPREVPDDAQVPWRSMCDRCGRTVRVPRHHHQDDRAVCYNDESGKPCGGRFVAYEAEPRRTRAQAAWDGSAMRRAEPNPDSPQGARLEDAADLPPGTHVLLFLVNGDELEARVLQRRLVGRQEVGLVVDIRRWTHNGTDRQLSHQNATYVPITSVLVIGLLGTRMVEVGRG